MIKVTFCLPRSIRVKLNSQCQYRCKFCHQEGNAKAANIEDNQLVEVLEILKKELGFYRVHFTGGEPTLYKQFARLLKVIKEIGFNNALTTNGQFDYSKLTLLKKSGLDSINFSLNAIEPYAFLNLQNISLKVKPGFDWAEQCIQKTIQNIITANKYLNTKVNCVVSFNSISAQKILEFCIQNDIKLRFLNDLGLGELSLDNIRKIVRENGAELVGHEITLLSSSHRLDYAIGSYQFGIKCIRKFFLKSLCKNCNFKNTNKCLEGFYGIRLEDNPLKVRLCLNKDKAPYVQSFKSFLESEQFKEIKTTMNCIISYLKKDSIIDEQKNLKVN